MAGLLLAFVLILAAIQLVASQRLEEKRQRVQRQKQKLTQLRDRVSNVLGVRAKLMERLNERFSRFGGEIELDDATGSIRLGSSILFDEGSAELKRRGREKLRTYMPVYFKALLGDPKLREHVGQIIFQGHTNSNYSGPGGEQAAYLYNLKLSQDRAFSAMRFVLDEGIGTEYDVRNVLQASGFSYSHLIYRENEEGEQVEDEQASRRIEIRFRLKGEKALRQLRRVFRDKLQQEDELTADETD
jgi:chemotaxis protein MotB